MCMAGELDNARDKMVAQVGIVQVARGMRASLCAERVWYWQCFRCTGCPPFLPSTKHSSRNRIRRVQPNALQVTQPGYQAFLRYMCPRWESAAVGGGPVPPGDDLSACPRPVLGTYDDHDYVNGLCIEYFELELGGKGGEDAGKRWCGC